MLEWATVSKGLGVAAKVLRYVPLGKRVLREVKTRTTYNQYRELHSMAHSLRDMAHDPRRLASDPEYAVRLAEKVAISCDQIMGTLLEMSPHGLHCCLKILQGDTGSRRSLSVFTLARSVPVDSRPSEVGKIVHHPVAKNTVWSALLGGSDGKTTWKPVPCFACNNLLKHLGDFQCTREDWPTYYCSTMVFPINYYTHAEARSEAPEIIGFLAFDSLNAGIFGKIPDAFEYRTDLAAYRDKLELTTAFQVGGLLADTLGAVMRPYYESMKASQPGEKHGDSRKRKRA